MAGNSHQLCIAFLLMSCLVSSILASLGCLDAQGSPVDWFIAYKLPQERENSNPLIKEGVAHMYMDVNHQSFSLSDVALNDSKQAIGYTLQQLYDNAGSQDVLYVLYNDAFPIGIKTGSNSKGHTKGVVLLDRAAGFWLVHSTPKFPNYAKNDYLWPHNARKYGQSFLCISMDASEFVKVGQQLMYNYPAIYDHNIPTTFQAQFTDFMTVVDGGHVENPPWNNTVLLTSRAGQEFTSFAKFNDFGQDLYSYWVAPTLEDSLYAETWMNEASKLPSYCNGTYRVENVATMSFPGVEYFKETEDHCKWAITEKKNWVCIGDINRTGSQFKRGGGTVCSLMPSAWSAFNAAIKTVSKCS